MDISPITIKTTIQAPIDRVWKMWNNPADVIEWNSPSKEWHTPKAENNLAEGQTFTYTMAARDGSMSFDFSGTYTLINENERIEYALADGRNVSVGFSGDGHTTEIIETFDPENQNPREMQQAGWQSILDNFRDYAERNA